MTDLDKYIRVGRLSRGFLGLLLAPWVVVDGWRAHVFTVGRPPVKSEAKSICRFRTIYSAPGKAIAGLIPTQQAV